MMVLERPMLPEDWECCERECSPCVWDTYCEALRQWDAEQKAQPEVKQDLEKYEE